MFKLNLTMFHSEENNRNGAHRIRLMIRREENLMSHVLEMTKIEEKKIIVE